MNILFCLLIKTGSFSVKLVEGNDPAQTGTLLLLMKLIAAADDIRVYINRNSVLIIAGTSFLGEKSMKPLWVR